MYDFDDHDMDEHEHEHEHWVEPVPKHDLYGQDFSDNAHDQFTKHTHDEHIT